MGDEMYSRKKMSEGENLPRRRRGGSKRGRWAAAECVPQRNQKQKTSICRLELLRSSRCS